MEKKSIGSFIAVLRKAKGMTQQDLAVKLNVSNKTVSKWECDETYPDISLIPVIAEVLGVSCDELLKGNRILRDNEENDEKTDKKITKQLKYLVDKNVARFKLFTIINIMFIILGGLVNFIISYSAYRPDIGFGIMTGIFIACITLEIIALLNLNSKFNDKDLFDNNGIDLEKSVNIVKFKYSFRFFYLAFFLFFLTLPLIIARIFSMQEEIAPIKSVMAFSNYAEALLYFIVIPIVGLSPVQSLCKSIFIKNSALQINKKIIIFDFIQLLLIFFCYAFNIVEYDGTYYNWYYAILFSLLIIVIGAIFLFCLRKNVVKDRRFNVLATLLRNIIFLFIPAFKSIFLCHLLIITTTALYVLVIKKVNFRTKWLS